MTNQELEKYRIQLFRDAAGMEKKAGSDSLGILLRNLEDTGFPL